MEKFKIISLVILTIISVNVFGQKPKSYSLEKGKVIVNNDTLFIKEKLNEPIPSFEKKVIIELVKNDSIEIHLVIKYVEKRSDKKIWRSKHQFFFQGKKLRGPSRWKTDLPFFSKLTGIGWRWEYGSDISGGTTISATTSASSARLPGKQGEIILICKETLFFD
jgi:hypothetical protein